MLLWGLPAIVRGQAPPDSDSSSSSEPASISEQRKRVLDRRYVWVSEYRFSAEEKRLLEPLSVDIQRSASVLRLPDTGIVRLYPWMRRRRVISIADLSDGRRPDFSSHACTYSFSKNKHGNGLNGFVDPRLGWAELKLGDGRFFTGFTGESLGVLVALGDVPLENITPETDGVSGLSKIIPPADYLEASSLSRRNRAGFELDRFSYGSSLPVLANSTYALRTTSNGRADLLVGFRIVRIDADGSVTLVWRRLKNYPKPEWKRRDE